MKKDMLFIVAILIVNMSSLSTMAADSFGPDEWNQYRMNSDKNAVFNNGSDPLEYQIFETSNEVRATPAIVWESIIYREL